MGTKYPTVNPADPHFQAFSNELNNLQGSQSDFNRSNQELISSAFPASPIKIESADYNEEGLKEKALILLNPKGDVLVAGNFQYPGEQDGFSLDYAVNIGEDLNENNLSSDENGFLPSSKWTPNLSSPGPGLTKETDLKRFILTNEQLSELNNNEGLGTTPGTKRPMEHTRRITVGSLLRLGSSEPEPE